jgi:hypothetical protein
MWAKPAAAVMAATMLSACFGSRAPLLGPADSAPLFGASGQARWVSFDGRHAGPMATVFNAVWEEDAYAVYTLKGQKEPAAYRFAPLDGHWLIVQSFETNSATYGLARREGGKLWTYTPECSALSDAERSALQLTMRLDGVCVMTSQKQLRATLKLIAARTTTPSGYYELSPAR